MLDHGSDLHRFAVKQLTDKADFNLRDDQFPLMRIKVRGKKFENGDARRFKPHREYGIVDMSEDIGLAEAGIDDFSKHNNSKKVIQMTDFIRVYDNALSGDFCNDFIQMFEKSPHLAQGTTSGGVDLNKKNSRDLYLNNHPEYQQQLQHIVNATTKHVFEYIEEHLFMIIGAFGLKVYHPKTGKPVDITFDNFDEVARPQIPTLVQQLFRLGPIQAQKYETGKGGYPYWHSEVYPQLGHNEALHRVLLFMFYLNDVPEGGETEFYYQNKKIAPKQGTMVIAPGYFTHTHRGNIPKSNDKYILTSWVLFNRAEQIYGQAQG